jgi:hypothetical protein
MLIVEITIIKMMIMNSKKAVAVVIQITAHLIMQKNIMSEM